MHEGVNKAIRLRRKGDPEAAGSLLRDFLRENPEDADANYQMAWTLDVRGMEREAIPHYRKALEAGLPREDRAGAMLSLGSSLRAVGEYGEAVEVLWQGASEFPEDRARQTFLAMALYNAGENEEAVKILLTNLVETTSDAGIKSYAEALAYYASRLDEVW